MNYARVALAAVGAFVFDLCYGYPVYGVLLAPEFARYPGVYRSADVGPGYLPLMFVGLLVAIVAAAVIYAKGYEGGSGVAEGGRFGLLLGLFVAMSFANVNYGTLNIGRKLAILDLAAVFIEWLVIGTIIGLIYKPAADSAR